jgi:hypothetical protein
MNHNRYILLIFISVLILNGCAVYYPQTTDIPLIKEKKELRVDGGISILPAVNGTVSYGLNDKVALQASGNLSLSGCQLSSAVGLYKFNKNNNWTKELYGGFGYGYASDGYYDYYHSGSLHGNYQIYYVQGNIGRRDLKLKFLEYAFGLKLGLINTHFSVTDVYTLIGQRPIQKYNELGAFIEPVISIKLGGKRLMFNIKPSFCYLKKIISTNDHHSDQVTHREGFGYEYPYFPYGIGLSLNYRFSK